MNHRQFKKLGRTVSEIGLGTWQLGAKWGDPFDETEALRILRTALDCGIGLIDTADIYNNGNSEQAIGRFLGRHRRDVFVVTKCGRGLSPHTAEGYTPEAMERFIDGSLSASGPTASTSSRCTARPLRSIAKTPSSTAWIDWLPKAKSRPTASASKRSLRACRLSSTPSPPSR